MANKKTVIDPEATYSLYFTGYISLTGSEISELLEDKSDEEENLVESLNELIEDDGDGDFTSQILSSSTLENFTSVEKD